MSNREFSRRFPYTRSVWHQDSVAIPATGSFEPGAVFDVVIVGGGISGAVAALTLCRAGARVALVEAETLAAGATGRSAGFIVPAFSVVRPRALLDSQGDRGLKLLRTVASSANEFFKLARAVGLESDAAQRGWIQPAHGQRAMDLIAQDMPVWQSIDAALDILDSATTEKLTGVAGYAGALFAKSGGTVHPVRFVQAVIGAAIAAGLHYFPETRAESMDWRGQRWEIDTQRGALSGKLLLVCTNARSKAPPALSETVVPLRVCQAATAPVPERYRARLLEQGQCLSDTRLNLFSYRFDAQWRLISGAMPVLPVLSGKALARGIATRLRDMLQLPFLPEIEHVWFGEASVTANRLPAVIDLGPHAYAMTACNGRGLAMSTVLSQALAEAICSSSFAHLPVDIVRPAPVKRRHLQAIGARFYPAYGQLRDALQR